MLEHFIKQATCIVNCDNAQGTGQLVTPMIVLTARHCVSAAIEAGKPISLVFFRDGKQQDLPATVLAELAEFDTCLLMLFEPLDTHPVPLSDEPPTEGSEWMSFGYPASKGTIGHRLAGTVAQILASPQLKMDIDLSVEPSVGLTAYEGMSGAGLYGDGVCKGLIRLGIDQGIGAISVLQLRAFLDANQVPVVSSRNSESDRANSIQLAERVEFERNFEERLTAASGAYIFLEGAHGIGKTTFCSSFSPRSDTLQVLGTYSLTTGKDGLGPAQKAQPEVFARWLETLISELLTGAPSRQAEQTYAQLVEACSSMLQAFGQHCVERGQQGVIFLDGLNESQAAGSDALTRLVGLLPMSLPAGVTIVLTAPNFYVIAPMLAGRVRSEAVVALPVLTDQAARAYCAAHPGLQNASANLVAAICTKAKGHPLYLRYVIEYVAVSGEPDALIDFPEFSGIIEDYYEVLWARLQVDADAVALLAIMARLRSGLPLEEFTPMLTVQENGVFVSVISRIRHLLVRPVSTTLYHPSFANFLISKTASIEFATHERIGDFCQQQSENKYCVVNLIFHLLRSNKAHRTLAISNCTQDWVDRCVTLGAEADTLLYDVDEVIDAAADSPNAVEVVRVLLLSQRLRFRYNVLFAQSAGAVAGALIALGRPEDAFNHVVRFGVLVCEIDVALQLAYDLVEGEHKQLALQLLTVAYDKIQESYEVELSGEDFLNLVAFNLRCLYLMHRASGTMQHRELQITLSQVMQSIEATFGGRESAAAQSAIGNVLASLFGTIITIGAQYNSLLKTYKAFGAAPENILDILAMTVLHVADLSKEYHIPLMNCCPPTIFKEIQFLSSKGMELNSAYVLNLLDVLIQCGAPVELIDVIAKGESQPVAANISLIKADDVSVDFGGYFQVSRELRVASFLSQDDECPSVAPFTPANWNDTFDDLLRALCWCEGRARRAKAEDGHAGAHAVRELLRERVLAPLEFTLAQRVEWERSYFIPEELVPLLYDRIVEVYAVCFPDALEGLLRSLHTRLPAQCGIYSEGFRKVLDVVVDTVSVQGASEAALDAAFEILSYRKDYVIRNVKNRHELVPELLRIIPAFVRHEAGELASSLYQEMLRVSMGPSWYKEDQLGLMNSAIRSVKSAPELAKILPQIGGYLEEASGEMTFQRYVRYDKSEFLRELFKHGYHFNGAQYFKRQTCGDVHELFAEASTGDLDRVGPLAGGRYPGRALDEQASMLDIVIGAEAADWRVRWALLEVYHYGDKRHLANYAKEYAKIVTGLDEGTEDFQAALKRLQVLISSEVAQKHQAAFVTDLKANLKGSRLEKVSSAIEALGLTEHIDEDVDRPWRRAPKAENDENGEPESKERDFHIPGIVGTTASHKAAVVLITQAESQLKKGNVKKAKELSVQMLREAQEGDWSVWGSPTDNSDIARAERILLSNSKSANELVQYYRPLILGESNVARWRVAEHLTHAMGSIATLEESMALVRCAVEHVGLIVGAAEAQISEYDFLSRESEADVSDVLFDLLLWLVDHPTWSRQEKAGELVHWILNQSERYFTKALNVAFSMAPGFAADVVSGVFDGMSRREPLQFWNKLSSGADFPEIIAGLRHIGRLSALRSSAKRGADLGSQTGVEICAQIDTILSGSNFTPAGVGGTVTLPAWANCIREPWQKLKKIGVIDDSSLARLTERMEILSQPLGVQTSYELERQVSKGFGVVGHALLNRWEGKVRFALNEALLPNATLQNIDSISSILRLFNPSSLAATRQFGNVSETVAIRAAIQQRSMLPFKGLGNDFFLHYREFFEVGGRLQDIEIVAVVTSDYDGHNTSMPSEAARFTSRETANMTADLGSHDTCYRVKPEVCFFGAHTPAYPQPGFIKLLGASGTDFSRKNWKQGRSHAEGSLGLPLSEGSMLTVKRSAVQRLRAGWGLSWLVFANGKLFASICHNAVER